MLYYLSWLDEDWVPVAEGADDSQRDMALAAASEVVGWHPLEVAVEADTLIDYLPNNVGVRLCSEHMRRVIDQVLGPLDRVQWLPAVVVDLFGTKHSYFVLHLPEDVDVLEEAKSIMAGDFVVKPVFSLAKTGGRNLLRVPESTITLIVTEKLRRALLAAECSGIDFEKAAVA